MAQTVIRVTEPRDPQFETIGQTGSRLFHVYFNESDDKFADESEETEGDNELADNPATKNYGNMISQASQAIDPSTFLSIPQAGTNFNGDEPTFTGQGIVRSINCSLFNEQNVIWEVEVRFGPADDDIADKFPWQEPRVYEWGSSTATVPTERDADGKAIENSAGDPFSDVTNITVAVQTVTARFNVKKGSFSPNKAKGLINTVNSGGFSIGAGSIASRTALLTAYNAKLSFATVNNIKVEYWAVTASWKIDVDDVGLWELNKLDIGWQAIDSNGKKGPILDENGEPHSSPQPLNGEGGRAAPAGQSVIGVGHLLEFQMYNRKGHSSID